MTADHIRSHGDQNAEQHKVLKEKRSMNMVTLLYPSTQQANTTQEDHKFKVRLDNRQTPSNK